MKRVLAVTAAVALVASSAAAIAQSKPSFAGKWTLVPDPNAPAAGGGRGRGFGGLGNAFTAAQDDKTLTVITNNPQTGEVKAVYNLDGSESKNPLTLGEFNLDRVSKVKWDGAKLVISTTTNAGGQTFESSQTWALDPSGNLIVESTSNFQGNATTTKSTYKKG